MAAAPFLTDLPVERPSGNGTHFDEPVIEPFLAKHSQWYRRHSKVQAQPQADPAQSPQRNSSVASETTAESAAPAPTAAAPTTTNAEPLSRAERNARRSSVVKALRWAFWYNGNE